MSYYPSSHSSFHSSSKQFLIHSSTREIENTMILMSKNGHTTIKESMINNNKLKKNPIYHCPKFKHTKECWCSQIWWGLIFSSLSTPDSEKLRFRFQRTREKLLPTSFKSSELQEHSGMSLWSLSQSYKWLELSCFLCKIMLWLKTIKIKITSLRRLPGPHMARIWWASPFAWCWWGTWLDWSSNTDH